ncbi:MAG: hypothetical protein E7337_10150 [Clostridiales bacterium]|nr:hypothetical protein [Clostridiales bacterium]
MKKLYRNEEPVLSRGMFANPPSEYRGAPFWAWNCVIEKDTLDEQIENFKKMGMGGYHVHVRTGMATPYLSDEFMGLVSHCVEKGKKEHMLTWLYDEDRWPSGTAGGKVTGGHPEFVMMNLLWTPNAYGTAGPVKDLGPFAGGRGGNREENGELLAVFDVELNEDGTLKNYRMIDADAPAAGTKWYAYAERAVKSAWFNDQPYIDTLNKKAVDRFIEITHERYKEVLGSDFGKCIPSMFTDEPAFSRKGTLDFATDKKDIFLAWTDSLEATFARRFGESLTAHLPELFWELPEGKISLIRYRFHEAVTEIFATSYCDTIGSWCEENGLMLAGHLLAEENLETQTRAIGEAMRSYRAFKDMPGIDILCDFHEYNTAKQAQSAKHQQGGEAMLSELYGVSSWDYDFRGYKLQGDWQAALGVTVRVPHLTWMSMKGEAKRDYPACIGYQSPWWDQFSLIENHFARLNTAMTRGKSAIRVAVVHPVESYWLYWGPKEQTAAVRKRMEEHFLGLTETLIFGNIDFDFICESRFPELCPEAGFPLKVGEMEYDHVIVPDMKTMRSTTLERLSAFRKAGGDVIFLGSCPDHVDACESAQVKPLYDSARHASFAPSEVLDALEDARHLDIRGESGARTDYLIHQMRNEGDGKWLFIARGKNPGCPDVDSGERVRIRIKGQWKLTVYDTMTGDIYPVSAAYPEGWTEIVRDWHDHDSLLLRLEPGMCLSDAAEKMTAVCNPIRVSALAEFITYEPNVLLLDRAEWAFDDGEWQPREELLRIDNLCRDALKIPRRAKYVLQPYLLAPETPEHCIRLRFTLESTCAIAGAALALEDAEDTKIVLNGETVPSVTDGWYVDKAIKKVALPVIGKGTNVLELTAPIGRRTNLEWCYLLGDFGVQLYGTEAVLTPRPEKIGYGSITSQGYPFYTGNFTYRFEVAAEGRLRIRIPKFRAALLKVTVDGNEAGRIAFAPYILETDVLPAGKHVIEVTAYGMRQNGFGQVHHEQGVYFYQNPNSWRSDGDLWLDEYQLHPLGILKAPEIGVIEG